MNNTQALLGFLPELPEFPDWPDPKLNYDSSCQHYWLSEEDVDKILDYFENKIPAYKHALSLYNQKMDIVIGTLNSTGMPE